MIKTDFDIAVIGGGASGFAAAISAAEKGHSVAIIEGNKRTGKKLIATGNGQGNIANSRLSPENYNNRCFAKAVFDKVPYAELINFFKRAGIEIVEKENGRIYPLSMQAYSVLDNLRKRASELGVNEICGYYVTKLNKNNGVFYIASGKGDTITAKAAIIACGGGASPHFSCGTGYSLLTSFGHKVTKLLPSLVQLKTEKSMIKHLKGVRLQDVTLRLICQCKETACYSGDVIFTDYGVSGSAVFEASSKAVRLIDNGQNVILSIDMLPLLKLNDVIAMLMQRKSMFPKREAAFLLNGVIPKQIAANILEILNIDKNMPVADICNNKICDMAKYIKYYNIKAIQPLGIEYAQVTAGGIRTDDFDGSLMSKLCADLYACGEVLDIDGGCGGYNLMWAFCSGILCGQSALK